MMWNYPPTERKPWEKGGISPLGRTPEEWAYAVYCQARQNVDTYVACNGVAAMGDREYWALVDKAEEAKGRWLAAQAKEGRG